MVEFENNDETCSQKIKRKLDELSPKGWITIMNNYTLIKGRDILTIISIIEDNESIEHDDKEDLLNRLMDRMDIDLDKMMAREALQSAPVSTNPMPIKYGRVHGIPAEAVDVDLDLDKLKVKGT